MSTFSDFVYVICGVSVAEVWSCCEEVYRILFVAEGWFCGEEDIQISIFYRIFIIANYSEKVHISIKSLPISTINIRSGVIFGFLLKLPRFQNLSQIFCDFDFTNYMINCFKYTNFHKTIKHYPKKSLIKNHPI